MHIGKDVRGQEIKDAQAGRAKPCLPPIPLHCVEELGGGPGTLTKKSLPSPQAPHPTRVRAGEGEAGGLDFPG